MAKDKFVKPAKPKAKATTKRSKLKRRRKKKVVQEEPMTMDSDTDSDEEMNADTEETAKASSNLKIIDLEALKQHDLKEPEKLKKFFEWTNEYYNLTFNVEEEHKFPEDLDKICDFFADNHITVLALTNMIYHHRYEPSEDIISKEDWAKICLVVDLKFGGDLKEDISVPFSSGTCGVSVSGVRPEDCCDYARLTNTMILSKISRANAAERKVDFTHKGLEKLTGISKDWYKYSSGTLALQLLDETVLLSIQAEFDGLSWTNARDKMRTKINAACDKLMKGDNGEIKSEIEEHSLLKVYKKGFAVWWRKRKDAIADEFAKQTGPTS